MPVTGDFAGLGQLERNLRLLSEVPSQVSKDASVEITKALKDEYKGGVDPYGKPWAPLRPSTLRRGRTPPPLTDRGILAGGTEAKPMSGSGIGITLGAPYGVFHQYGTAKMVARKILPEGKLPARWYKAIKDATLNAIRRTLG